MKWITLSEQIPPKEWSGVIRRIGWDSGNARLVWGDIRKEWMVEENDGYGGLELYPNLEDFEWLDESDGVKYVDSMDVNPEEETYLNVSGNTPEEENYYPNVVPDVVGELMDQPLTQQKVLKLLVDKDVECNMKLKEQHRNIRHDILEAIAKSVGGQGDMYNAIAGHMSDIIKNVLETKPI